MPLDDLFQPDGEWRSEYEKLDTADLDGSLRKEWNSLKILWNRELARKLSSVFGVKTSHMVSFVREEMRRILEGEPSRQALDDGERALVWLVVESLASPGASAHFPIMTEADRRASIRALDPRPNGTTPSFTGFKGLDPKRVMRLAITAPSLKWNTAIAKREVPRAILGALSRLVEGGSIPTHARIRLAALRFWVITDGGQDLEADSDRLLQAAGLDAAEMVRIVDDLSSERGVERLLSEEGRTGDLVRLLEFPRFRESAEYFGFRLDPKTIELQGQLEAEARAAKDPWVRRFLTMALGSDERGPDAAKEFERLPADRRGRRESAIAYLWDRRILSTAEFTSLVESEFPPMHSAEPTYRSLLLATIVARHGPKADEVNRVLDGAGLLRWIEESESAYRSDAQRAGIRIPDPDRMERSARTFASVPNLPGPLRPFAGFFREEADRLAKTAERREAEHAGRGWLHDFILSLRNQSEEAYDGSRRILTDEDREVCRRLLMDAIKKRPGWWEEPMQADREMRLREAALRQRIGSREDLESLVERTVESFRSACDGVRPERLEQVLSAIARLILDGVGSVDPSLAESFRNDEVDEFRSRLSPARVVLLGSRATPRLLGWRLASYSILLVAVLGVFTAIRTSAGTQWPDVNEPTVVGDDGASFEPSKQGFVEFDPGTGWALVVPHAAVSELFGDGILSPVASGGPARVEFVVAREWIERYSAAVRARYVRGLSIPGGGRVAWSGVEFRLGDVKDPLNCLKAVPEGLDASVWMSDGSLRDADGDAFAGPHDLRKEAILVIIRRK